MERRVLPLLALLALVACTTAPQDDTAMEASSASSMQSDAASSEVSSLAEESLADLPENPTGLLYVSDDFYRNPFGTIQRTSFWHWEGADEPTKIGSVESINRAMAYNDGSVYFINLQDTLSRYDLRTHKTELFPIPEAVMAVNKDGSEKKVRVHDLSLTSDGELRLLLGGCGIFIEGEGSDACLLTTFDLESKNHRVVADVAPIIPGRMGIGFPPKTGKDSGIILHSLFIDAGHGAGTIFSVDPMTGTTKKVTEASYGPCDPTCDAATKAENDRFETFFPWTLVTECGPWRQEDDSYKFTIQKDGKTVRTEEYAHALACLD